MKNKSETRINDIAFGEKYPLVLIAGPCVIETEKDCCRIAEKLKDITDKAEIPFIFKASYDKANRTSIKSYRGPGVKRVLRFYQRLRSKSECLSFLMFIVRVKLMW